MPTGGQVATAAGVAAPTLIASGLAIGGYHNRPIAYSCFALAALAFVIACLYVPLKSLFYRKIGFAPVRASHSVIGGAAVLRLDLGTQPAVTDLACQVHLPQAGYVGIKTSSTATLPPGSTPSRHTTFMFPHQFGLEPVYFQAMVLGWYQVDWIVTQHGSQRTITTDRFHLKRPTTFTAMRKIWVDRDRKRHLWAVLPALIAELLKGLHLLGKRFGRHKVPDG